MGMAEDRHVDARVVSGMDDVDRSGHAETHVRYLDAAADILEAQGALNPRHAAFLALGLQPGDQVLDVGCGLGEAVMEMAERVGGDGRVIGLDASQTMIDEARQRAEGSGLPVEFVLGNAYELPFADGSFSACREERMLQHLDDPSAAIAEMVRVTGSGGRVAATDPDWELWAIDVPDRALFRKLQAYSVDSYRTAVQGWLGRQLYRLFNEAGLVNLAVLPVVIPFTNLAQANAMMAVLDVADEAREKGVISQGERDQWHQCLHEADEAGEFFTALGGFTVIGTKP